MSILTELKKLTKKKNATVVSQALPDSLDGGSGSGGGANVLTLYANFSAAFSADSFTFTVYKNADLTEQYASQEEAINAIAGAGAIVIVLVESSEENIRLYPIDSGSGSDHDHVAVDVIIDTADGLKTKGGILYQATR